LVRGLVGRIANPGGAFVIVASGACRTRRRGCATSCEMTDLQAGLCALLDTGGDHAAAVYVAQASRALPGRFQALDGRTAGRCSNARTGNDARRRGRRGQVLAARGHRHRDDVERLLTARRSCRLLALDVHKEGVRRA